MGLFNKLKNVLFEEEEIEIPVKETEIKKPVKQEENFLKKPLERKKPVMEEPIKDEPVLSDQELFKAEKTFDFPVFDDQEFENMKSLTAEEPPKEEPKKSMGINLFDYEKPRIKREETRSRTPEIKGRVYDTKKSEDFSSRKFTPSPVISPVYGVLDKNYKKEDIVVKKEEKKAIEIDAVRKKAFGTLEDNIEKSLHEKKESRIRFEEDEKVDRLLEEAVMDSIEVSDKEATKRSNKVELEVMDKPKEKSPQAKVEEDTLENDLFDLIDSMYENKEDE